MTCNQAQQYSSELLAPQAGYTCRPSGKTIVLVLGIETSCDETGIALYESARGLLAHALHSQVAMHEAYGGVVPELASRDHIRRVVPLAEAVLREAGVSLADLDGVAYTQGPGLAGALLVGAGVANGLGFALGIPALGVHHLEGHLLSPLLASPRPAFPFVALLVSGGHSQLYAVGGVGDYTLLGDTQDDAAGEAGVAAGVANGPASTALKKPARRAQAANRRGHADGALPGSPRPQPWPPLSNTCSSLSTLLRRSASNITRLLPMLAMGSSAACARNVGGVSWLTCSSTE